MSLLDRFKRLFGARPASSAADERPQHPHEADDGHAAAPGEAAAAPLRTGKERRQKSRPPVNPNTRVLIIDDSATIVATLRKMMRQNGFVTYEAGDAESGLEVAQREVPDLVFLDIVLPGMNGFSALRQLRRDARTSAIPVIMISGNAQATEEFYVQRIGADDFMKKPFSRAEIFARIERLVDDDGVPRRLTELARLKALRELEEDE